MEEIYEGEDKSKNETCQTQKSHHASEYETEDEKDSQKKKKKKIRHRKDMKVRTRARMKHVNSKETSCQ